MVSVGFSRFSESVFLSVVSLDSVLTVRSLQGPHKALKGSQRALKEPYKALKGPYNEFIRPLKILIRYGWSLSNDNGK